MDEQSKDNLIQYLESHAHMRPATVTENCSL